jgi:hypothetical protein
MGLPKLTVKLFAPKPGKSYAAAGNLTIPLGDVHALAEWLLAQSGEYDGYLKENVVRLLAFEYKNTSRGGNAYRTVQLRDPAELASSAPSQPAPGWSPPAVDGTGGFDDEEVPF